MLSDDGDLSCTDLCTAPYLRWAGLFHDINSDHRQENDDKDSQRKSMTLEFISSEQIFSVPWQVGVTEQVPS